MLPVALAHARRTGVCPAFPPLAVLATGALLHDSIAVVEGLDAKAGLAARLGAAFIAPECATGARTLGLRVGQPYRDVLPAVTSFLQGQGLTAMTPRQAAEGAMQLWGEVGVGAVSLPEAQARLAHYEDALQRAGDDLGTVDGIARVWLLRGSIANHSGRPAEADHCLAEAAARCAQHPVAFADTLASWVVSLTDLGQYDEAESLGRQLLYWVGAGFRGSEQDHARCRITACGALGGQPLLFKAVLGQETGAESLMLLQQARALALKLDSADHACRDAVQVALWHALLAPATYQGECDTACALLARYPGESAVSQGYLHRARLLGAYRAWLAGAAPGQGFDAWLLPDASIGHLGWVRATALKYRGALLANEGRTEESQADFDEALELLDAEGAPLIRFIAGTVALQAAESLGGTTARVGYLDAAETVFRAFAGWFQGPIAAERWLERATVLRQAGAPCGTSPQVWFPY
jgi:tetratricopeptide (TPR) repeat protein